jgi:hypothetical protein
MKIVKLTPVESTAQYKLEEAPTSGRRELALFQSSMHLVRGGISFSRLPDSVGLPAWITVALRRWRPWCESDGVHSGVLVIRQARPSHGCRPTSRCSRRKAVGALPVALNNEPRTIAANRTAVRPAGRPVRDLLHTNAGYMHHWASATVRHQAHPKPDGAAGVAARGLQISRSLPTAHPRPGAARRTRATDGSARRMHSSTRPRPRMMRG